MALVETLCGFQAAVGACSSRPRLRQRPHRGRTQERRARFTPLDGRLPCATRARLDRVRACGPPVALRGTGAGTTLIIFCDRSCIATGVAGRGHERLQGTTKEWGVDRLPWPAGSSTTAACERFARLDNGAAPNARHTRLPPDGQSHPTSSAAGSCTPHPECEAPSARRGRNMPKRATPAVRWFQMPSLIRPLPRITTTDHDDVLQLCNYKAAVLSAFSKSERTSRGAPALHARLCQPPRSLLATLEQSQLGMSHVNLGVPADGKTILYRGASNKESSRSPP